MSADMAHAVHPNYSDKHEGRMQISLDGGPALKYHCNQKYATNAVTASILREIGIENGIQLQEVGVRQDSGCGSTIGPITASGLSVPTVDIGCFRKFVLFWFKPKN